MSIQSYEPRLSFSSLWRSRLSNDFVPKSFTEIKEPLYFLFVLGVEYYDRHVSVDYHNVYVEYKIELDDKKVIFTDSSYFLSLLPSDEEKNKRTESLPTADDLGDDYSPSNFWYSLQNWSRTDEAILEFEMLKTIRNDWSKQSDDVFSPDLILNFNKNEFSLFGKKCRVFYRVLEQEEKIPSLDTLKNKTNSSKKSKK